MPAFEFTFSEPFLIEAFRRTRQSRRQGNPLLFVFRPALLGLGAAGIFLLHSYPAGATLVLVAIFGQRVTELLTARRFRKSPYYNEHVCSELSSEGLTGGGSIGAAKFTWAAFTSARRFSDGFLLFQGPNNFNWLPNRALVEGTVEEVDQLLQEHVVDYRRG